MANPEPVAEVIIGEGNRLDSRASGRQLTLDPTRDYQPQG
jgi:hypothetical protein